MNEPPSWAQTQWVASGQLQGIPLRFTCTDSSLFERIDDFLSPLVANSTCALSDSLEFSVDLFEGKRGCSVPSGKPALIQFAGISCVHENSLLSFYTKEGSFIKADIQAGRAWGAVSTELLHRKPYLLIDLLMGPLMEMLKERGFYGLHAAALTKDGTGFLFPGNTESGKTSTALSMVTKGFQYLADDKVLLRQESSVITALAFTRRFNIAPDSSRHYPELRFLEDRDPLPFTVKRPYDISTIYSNACAPRSTPRFVIHLEMTTSDKSQLYPITSRDSFFRLTRQSILSSRKHTASRQLTLLSELATRTESFVLSNGKDVFGNPERLLELLPDH